MKTGTNNPVLIPCRIRQRAKESDVNSTATLSSGAAKFT